MTDVLTRPAPPPDRTVSYGPRPEHVTDPSGTFAGRVEAPVVGRLPESLEQWLPLSYALNALSRSLGNQDLYPFVLAPPVVEKLAFVDRAVHLAARGADAEARPA